MNTRDVVPLRKVVCAGAQPAPRPLCPSFDSGFRRTMNPSNQLEQKQKVYNNSSQSSLQDSAVRNSNVSSSCERRNSDSTKPTSTQVSEYKKPPTITFPQGKTVGLAPDNRAADIQEMSKRSDLDLRIPTRNTRIKSDFSNDPSFPLHLPRPFTGAESVGASFALPDAPFQTKPLRTCNSQVPEYSREWRTDTNQACSSNPCPFPPKHIPRYPPPLPTSPIGRNLRRKGKFVRENTPTSFGD
jgi:hypothetical protein